MLDQTSEGKRMYQPTNARHTERLIERHSGFFSADDED